ncbi:MAG: rRNA maturation RNAse YbeY, partial [Actinomycetota bacterium]
VDVDVDRWHALARNILVAEGVRGAAELTLMFVPESTIAGLNEKYMGKSGATDVLSFPLDAVEAGRAPGPGAISRGPNKTSTDLSEFPILLATSSSVRWSPRVRRRATRATSTTSLRCS